MSDMKSILRRSCSWKAGERWYRVTIDPGRKGLELTDEAVVAVVSLIDGYIAWARGTVSEDLPSLDLAARRAGHWLESTDVRIRDWMQTALEKVLSRPGMLQAPATRQVLEATMTPEEQAERVERLRVESEEAEP